MHKILTAQHEALLRRERDLFSSLERILPQLEAPADDLNTLARTRQQLDEFFLLVVVGEFNSGKSAFINALLGTPLLDEGVTPTTSQVHIIQYGEQVSRHQIEPYLLRLQYPVAWLQDINIVDTPGTNAIIQRHQQITEAFIPRSDLVLFVTAASQPISDSERDFLEKVRSWGKKVVVVINKIDLLETPASRQEVETFVREQITAILGTIPVIFPVSAKAALAAKTNPDPAQRQAMLHESRFHELETFILQRLDQKQRLRLKLESPLGVAEHLRNEYQQRTRERLDLLQEDFSTIDAIDAELNAYVADMRHDFSFRLNRIDNILHDMRGRGDEFFEETIRMGRFFDLINSARLRSEFERQVVADTHTQIEAEVSDIIDWMVDRNFRQWQDITRYLNQRTVEHRDKMVGDIGGQFDSNRQKLLQSVGRAAREVVSSYDKSAEARQLSESVQSTLAAMGAVEVGAIGVGAVLLHVLTRALDPLGVIAAGGIAFAGLFILPARRRAAKRNLDSKIDGLRSRLEHAINDQFERELANSVQAFREAISPYTRFIRVEYDKMQSLHTELSTLGTTIAQVRLDVAALDG
ncbi:MAG: GTP-binding protein [Chloroflexi bacterium]|nr:GTP-binding protein [Chloroflexota bacterium]